MSHQSLVTYDILCRRRGVIVWSEKAYNLTTNEGLDDLLDKYFKGAGYTADFYLGLASATPVPAAGDTLASHAGWSEITAYASATRTAFTPGAASGGVISNSAVPDTVTVNASATVGGVFITTGSAKGGTTGKLVSIAAFAGGNQAVVANDILEITATVTAIASLPSFPVLVAADNGLSEGNFTTHPATMPTNIVAGDLLIAQFAFQLASGITVTWPAGWTQLSIGFEQGASGQAMGAVAAKIAGASEPATINIITNFAHVGKTIISRITGHGHSAGDLPEAAVATDPTALPDPPALTPTGGIADYLWLCFLATGGGDDMTPPVNYANTPSLQVSKGAFGVGQAAQATRDLRATTDNPGTWAGAAGTKNNINFLMAIKP